jgi:hypothetical protein
VIWSWYDATHAAAVFRAGHAEHVTQHAQERGVAVDIDAVRVPVHFEGNGHGVLLVDTNAGSSLLVRVEDVVLALHRHMAYVPQSAVAGSAENWPVAAS